MPIIAEYFHKLSKLLGILALGVGLHCTAWHPSLRLCCNITQLFGYKYVVILLYSLIECFETNEFIHLFHFI